MTLIGKTIGNFRVTDLAGTGGMGEVYVGYDERLKRRVALKALRGERRFDERIKARLLREAEILSRLEHPHICRIYDLIETDDADVLVLELIKGKTLGKVSIQELSHAEKLKIAIQVGEALTDAHAHGVVHRDLKPDNVMLDERGDVKVLDFGLAHSCMDQNTATMIRSEIDSGTLRSKAASVEWLPEEGLRTEHGVIMGTPMYMSLEQARFLPVTAASDMYSFGLLLQWLFTGLPPYPRDLNPMEIFHRAGEGKTAALKGVKDDLKKLINRLKSIDPAARPIAHDTVVHLKRIEDAPRRRARRIAMLGAIAVLTVGIIMSGYSLYRTKESERKERLAHARAEKMSSFLVDMWVSPSPMEQGRDVKVVDVLAYGRDKVEDEFHDEPVTKATLLIHLATTYRRLGEYEKAEAIITDCLEFCRHEFGDRHPSTISAMIELGILLSYDERVAESEVLLRDALAAGTEVLPENNELLVYAKVQLAENLMKVAGFEEAEVLLEEALVVIRGNENLRYKLGPKALLDLGNILLQKEDLAAAENVFVELIEEYEAIGDTDNPNYVAAVGSAGRIFLEQGKHGMGLQYMRKGLDLSTRINGERHRTTLAFLINLGQGLAELGRYEEALVYTERGLTIFEEIFGERAPDTVFIKVNYAYLLVCLGRFEEAEPILHEAVALNLELLGDEHPYTLNSQYVMGFFLYESGRIDEAEPLLRELLARSTRTLGEDMHMTLECQDLLGLVVAGRGDFEEAEGIHREVLEHRLASQENQSSISNTMFHLAECLYRQDEFPESCRLAEQALRARFEVFGGDHPLTSESVALMTRACEASGNAEGSEALLESLGLNE